MKLLPRRCGVGMLGLLFLLPQRFAGAAPSAPPVSFDLEHPAEVVAVERGRATLRGEQPIHIGDRFALVKASGQADVVEAVAVFEIDAVEGTIASGRLPRGVQPAVGDRAIPTTARVRDRLLTPAPWRGITRGMALLRPTLTTNGSNGFALLGELSIEHHFRAPFLVGLAAAPVALVAVGTGNAESARFLASAAYDGTYFEAGVELGADLHSVVPSGFLLGLRARGGTRDGFHFTTHLSVVVGSAGTQFGGLGAELDIPLTRLLTLNAAGAGAIGWGYGTLGLKTYLKGSGGPGTLILLTAVGAVVVREIGAFGFGVLGYGPSLAVGLELRR